VPATRTRAELEQDDNDDDLSPPLSYLHPSLRARQSTPPIREPDSDWSRARKRLRVDSLSSVTSVERSLIPDESFPQAAAMRLPEHDDDPSLSLSLADVPEAGPSSIPNILSNGHNGLMKGNSVSSFTNGNGKVGATDGLKAEKQKMSVPKVLLPGTTLYDDSYVDREEFVRLVIQSLRDVGYMWVPLILYLTQTD
jgi:hypothetical protein